MGNFRVRTTFNKRLGQTAPSAWKFPKTEFLRLHPHSDLIVDKHTEQVRKLLMDSSWHALSYKLQVKTLCHTGKEGFGYLWLSKNFQTHPPNLLKPSPVLERSAYHLQNCICFSPLTSIFATNHSLWQTLDWGLLSEVVASMKIGIV